MKVTTRVKASRVELDSSGAQVVDHQPSERDQIVPFRPLFWNGARRNSPACSTNRGTQKRRFDLPLGVDRWYLDNFNPQGREEMRDMLNSFAGGESSVTKRSAAKVI